MKNTLKIGLIIADKDEYAPLVDKLKDFSATETEFYSLKSHTAHIKRENGEIVIRSVLCGIGKVNAGVATAYLIAEGVDVILNFGLAGGVSGVKRGELALATAFAEHDFDLTCFGYKAGEKPDQKYVYFADERLNKLFLQTGAIANTGAVVSGDSFINDEQTRTYLKDEFSAVACDMESAAVAYACTLSNVPFASLKKISDDAGSDATVSYRSMNALKESSLVDVVFEVLKNINISEFDK